MTTSPVLDFQFWNNGRLQMSRDVSGWSVAYDLDAVEWVFQIRRAAESAAIILNVSVAYTNGIVVFSASTEDVANVPPGTYVFDYGFIPSVGEFIRCEGGTAICEQGVTRP